MVRLKTASWPGYSARLGVATDVCGGELSTGTAVDTLAAYAAVCVAVIATVTSAET